MTKLPHNNLSASYKVVLVKPLHAGNMGAVARVMMNMDLDDLVLVNPREDPFSKESLDRAVDAKPILKKAKIASSLKEAVSDCHLTIGTCGKRRQAKKNNLSSTQFGRLTQTFVTGEKIALVFGSEDVGLTTHEIPLCDYMVEIEASMTYGSLNISHAAAILFYEIFINSKDRDFTPKNKEWALATNEQCEPMYRHLFEAMMSVNFLDPQNPERIFGEVKNILGRSNLDVREVELLRGFANQILNAPFIKK